MLLRRNLDRYDSVSYTHLAGTVAQIDSRLLLSGFVYRFVASKLPCLGPVSYTHLPLRTCTTAINPIASSV